jgi:sugar/nucleoside kinase (ribokinase family)
MERRGIICGVAWCVDRILTIERWPPEETVANVVSERHFGGCPGHNMATALRRLGAEFPVEALGLIGDDADGRLLTAACDELGIARNGLIARDGVRTSHTLVMSSAATGKRTFFNMPGAHAVMTPDDFDFSATSARFAHLGLPGLHDRLDRVWNDEASGWVALLKRANAAGIKCNLELASVDPEMLRNIGLPLLPHLHSLIINDVEVGALAGIATADGNGTNIAACRLAAEKLMTLAPMDLLAVHFPSGAIALTRDGGVHERASVRVPAAAIIGSNGAGDAFAAGLLFGLHEDWPLPQSLRLAHASAAASLRSETTTGTIMPWQDCLDLAEQWGWRD